MALRLSVREIIVAAAMCKRAKLYAIPDDFEGLPQEQLSAAIQNTKNGLWEKHLLSMDFDGNTTLSEEVKQVVLFCAECSKYLSVVSRSRDAVPTKIVVWKRAKQFLYAVVQERTYSFSFMQRDEVEKCLLRMFPWNGKGRSEKTTMITQAALKKAKRCVKSNDLDGAALLLRQQGADDAAARIIANALFENTAVFSIVTVDQTTQPPVSDQCMFSVDEEGYLIIEPAMEGYRSAAAFEDITERKLKSKVLTLLGNFISAGGAADEE